MKTHWRKIIETDYLGGVDLDDGQGGHKDVTATIAQTKRETVKDQNGTEDTCLVLHFSEKLKPMILNVTNSKTLEKLVGTGYIEDWVGRKIQIGTEKVKAFGEVHDALRIRKVPPKPDQAEKCADCRQTIKGTDEATAETIIAGTRKR